MLFQSLIKNEVMFLNLKDDRKKMIEERCANAHVDSQFIFETRLLLAVSGSRLLSVAVNESIDYIIGFIHLKMLGFQHDATIIEEDTQACVYATMTRGMKYLDLTVMLMEEVKWDQITEVGISFEGN